jgi:hypothetical protein
MVCEERVWKMDVPNYFKFGYVYQNFPFLFLRSFASNCQLPWDFRKFL